MQLKTLTLALLAVALSVTDASANPLTSLLQKRNACRRADGTIELREWDGSLLPRADGCTLENSGGPGFPLPNSWCKATYGSETPCCVENGVGGAYCSDCTHGVHNC